jgi:hypothetical protein
MVMQDIDYNWQALKEEDRTLLEKQPHKMIDATDIQIVQWHNNSKQQKLTWRETMVPYTAWIDVGDAKGMWRAQENRIVEEMQADYAINQFGKGYKIIKSTPRSETGEALLNAKIIQIECCGDIQEVLLILDGNRILLGKLGKIKGGIRWTFKDSVSIGKLL